MYEVEVVGNEQAIDLIKSDAGTLLSVTFTKFQVSAAAGTAGIFGLVAQIPASVIEKLIDFLPFALKKDRNLEVNVNGTTFKVADVKELSDVLAVLGVHGLLSGDHSDEASDKK